MALHRAAHAAADHAAEAIVIYDLRRDGAYELGRKGDRKASADERIVPSARHDIERLTAGGRPQEALVPAVEAGG